MTLPHENKEGTGSDGESKEQPAGTGSGVVETTPEDTAVAGQSGTEPADEQDGE